MGRGSAACRRGRGAHVLAQIEREDTHLDPPGKLAPSPCLVVRRRIVLAHAQHVIPLLPDGELVVVPVSIAGNDVVLRLDGCSVHTITTAPDLEPMTTSYPIEDFCRSLGGISCSVDPVEVRRRIGMVFQKANPFPKSIYENIAYGPRIHGLVANRADLDEVVQTSLRKAGLWEEVKDRLDHPGTSLSGGQQQRLCIARAIAVDPEVILMDEPCSALDPIATARIEDLIDELRQSYSIVIVTHNMQQAARVSQRTAYFHLGDLIEVGPTDQIFTNPRHKLTEDYITGRFG